MSVYLPGQLMNVQCGTVINANFTAIDDKCQVITEALLGDPLDLMVGLNDVNEQLTEFEAFLESVDQDKLAPLDMAGNTNTNCSDLAIALGTDYNTCIMPTACDPAAINRWAFTPGASPFSMIGNIVTIDTTLLYCSIGNRLYRSHRRGLSFEIEDGYALVAANNQRGGLTDRRKRSYPSLGSANGNRYYCEGIGGASVAIDNDWQPTIGDEFHCQDKVFIISDVQADYVEFANRGIELTPQNGPEWHIDGYYEPYIGVLPYTIDLCHDTGVVVMAVMRDRTLEILYENTDWNSYRYKYGVFNRTLSIAMPCSEMADAIKSIRMKYIENNIGIVVFKIITTDPVIPQGYDQQYMLMSIKNNIIYLRSADGTELAVSPVGRGNFDTDNCNSIGTLIEA